MQNWVQRKEWAHLLKDQGSPERRGIEAPSFESEIIRPFLRFWLDWWPEFHTRTEKQEVRAERAELLGPSC